MRRTFDGAYCAQCETWQPTSEPVPALRGVYACAECAAKLAQVPPEK